VANQPVESFLEKYSRLIIRKKGIKSNCKTGDWRSNLVSPLYMAVVSNLSDMVDILISESREGSVKSPASYAGPDGQTALHAAVFARNGMVT